MTPVLFILLAAAGGIGATSRMVLDGVIRSRGTLPLGTVTINLTGSLLLGLLTGITTAELVPEVWQLVVGTGFLGGYTTFSTASFETVRLLQERKRINAALNSLGTLFGSVMAAALGLWLGTIW